MVTWIFLASIPKGSSPNPAVGYVPMMNVNQNLPSLCLPIASHTNIKKKKIHIWKTTGNCKKQYTIKNYLKKLLLLSNTENS